MWQWSAWINSVLYSSTSFTGRNWFMNLLLNLLCVIMDHFEWNYRDKQYISKSNGILLQCICLPNHWQICTVPIQWILLIVRAGLKISEFGKNSAIWVVLFFLFGKIKINTVKIPELWPNSGFLRPDLKCNHDIQSTHSEKML